MFELFSSNRYNKEGPGVSADAPRKTGAARFFEILGRDFTSFWLSGIIALAVYTPLFIVVSMGISSGALFFTLIAGFFGGLIGAPFYACLFDTILRAQRDEPGYWFNRYRKAFKSNWKESLLPGGILGMCLSMQIIAFVVYAPADSNVAFLAALFVSVFLTIFISIWYFAQLVVFQMQPIELLKNSVLLAFSKLPRTFGAALFHGVYWFTVIFFLPLSGLVAILTNFWLPVFLALSFIYPALNETFALEEKVNAKREEELFGDES